MTWSFQLLDDADRPLGALDGVNGGRCEIVAQSPLGGSASMSIDKRRDIDWMSDRVQAWWDGPSGSWAAGTWLFTSPQEQHTEFGVTFEVGLLTKVSVISEDSVDTRYTLNAGTPIIPAVVALIQSTGETRIAHTDSPTTLTSALTWEPGTPKLSIINDLLQAAGYWSLWCDGAGQFRVEPYVAPQERSPAYVFEHGEASVHFPDWTREQDMTSVPNRVVLQTQGSDTEPVLRGVATNQNPDSPFSYQARGRWISPQTETVEAASQTVIDQLAARRLADAMSPVSRLSVSHAMLDLNPNDVVEFIPEDGARRLASIQRMSMDFDEFTDVSAEWREVF